MERLSREFSVEVLKARYFRSTGEEEQYQAPVNREMLARLFERNDLGDLEFEFYRSGPFSYQVSFEAVAGSDREQAVSRLLG